MKELKKRKLSGKKLGRPFKYDWSKWDDNITIRENCQRLFIGYKYGARHCFRLGLKFKHERIGRPKKVLL